MLTDIAPVATWDVRLAVDLAVGPEPEEGGSQWALILQFYCVGCQLPQCDGRLVLQLVVCAAGSPQS